MDSKTFKESIMAKKAIASFKYDGNKGELEAAVRKSLERMKLKYELLVSNAGGFSFTAKEPMRWLTTNYPVHFTIDVAQSGDQWAVIIEGGCTLTSLTQDSHNSQRVKELREMICTLAPGASS
jgi:hypothetical protein